MARPQDMSLGGRLFMGGCFALAGLVVLGFAATASETGPGTMDAPVWVVATSGTMFALVGMWIMSVGTVVGGVLEKSVGPLVMIGLLSILHWIAFGAGVRQCSGGISIPFLSTNRPVGDLECRIAFGYGALLFDGILLGAMLTQWAKKLEGTTAKIVNGIGGAFMVVPLAPLIAVVVAGTAVKAAWAKVRGESARA